MFFELRSDEGIFAAKSPPQLYSGELYMEDDDHRDRFHNSIRFYEKSRTPEYVPSPRSTKSQTPVITGNGATAWLFSPASYCV